MAHVPDWQDLEEFLQAAKLMPIPPDGYSASLDLTLAIADGLTRFEAATGFRPFEAAEADSTRVFDPTGDFLDLRGGLAALTGVTLSGTALVNGTDFWPGPANALAEGQPYTSLEFAAWQTGTKRSLSVTGKWGFCLYNAVPDGARQTILAFAAWSLGPSLAAALSEGKLRWEQLDVKVEYGANPLSGVLQGWEKQFGSGVRPYRRSRIA